MGGRAGGADRLGDRSQDDPPHRGVYAVVADGPQRWPGCLAQTRRVRSGQSAAAGETLISHPTRPKELVGRTRRPAQGIGSPAPAMGHSPFVSGPSHAAMTRPSASSILIPGVACCATAPFAPPDL